MPVIKDLVVDMNPFWNKVKQVGPFMMPENTEPEGEYIASNESMTHLVDVMNCIMCGACVSDCTALEVDESFIGPAALAKAYVTPDGPTSPSIGSHNAKRYFLGSIKGCFFLTSSREINS